MESKRIEIDGIVYDLSDPDGKKAAVRAWLQARSQERSSDGQAASPSRELPGSEAVEPDGPAGEGP